MEVRTREINEVKVYKLIMNRMTSSHVEDSEIAAVATNYETLCKWYQDQKASEVWRDGRWGKTFKKGSPLEWYNPVNHLDLNQRKIFGQGVEEEWISEHLMNSIIHGAYGVFLVPENYQPLGG